MVIGFEEWRALAAAGDAATWDRIRARQARTSWLDHDEVVRWFAAERGWSTDRFAVCE